MYDFCLTFPYAAGIALGGIVAFTGPSHSVPSLQAAGVSAGLLGIAGVGSLAAYDKGRKAPWATGLSLAVAAALTVGMGARYMDSGEKVPGLLVAAPSAAMTAFYAWCLAKGPAPPPPKKKAAPKKNE